MPIIDAHHHVWDLSAHDQPFLDQPGLAPLRRNFLLADLEPQYKFGVGHMDVDLRRLELPATTTQVNLKLGMGEARVRVPAGTCVVTDAKIGVGAADLSERAGQGFDLSIDHGIAGTRTLRVNADIGVGHLPIDNAERCA